MHPGFHKDYRFLLSNLIPRHFLSAKRVEGIIAALAEDSRDRMISEAYLALEELVLGGSFRRDPVKRELGIVSVSYSMVGKPARISLEMSAEEWEGISGERTKPAGILSSVLAGIISSLSLNDSPKHIVTRVEEMLALADNIYNGAKGYLLLLEGELSRGMEGRPAIRTSSWSTVSTNRFYRSCMTSGMSHTYFRLSGAGYATSCFDIDPASRSIILIPLISGSKRLGLLELHLPSETAPARDTFVNLYMLGQGIVRLLENNKQLEKMVSIDRLTQVHNRNYYESQMPLEIERANRDRKSLAFLIIDIDDFKKFNDSYGHEVGDEVLTLTAQTIRFHLRKIDLLFRYGGEEFIALLPGASTDDAERTAERIREVVEKKCHIIRDGSELNITISVGGCIYPAGASDKFELFRRADQALYESKNRGKNRVSFYSPKER